MSLPGAIRLRFNPWLAFGLLVVSLYMLHWFCWRLGLLYREHHPKFPWVLQQHVRSKKWQEYVERRKRKYVAPAENAPAAPPVAKVAPAHAPVQQGPPAKIVAMPVQPLPQQPQQPRRAHAVESVDQRL